MVEDEVLRITRRYGKPEDKEAVEGKEDIVYVSYQLANVEQADKVEDTAILERYPVQLQSLFMGKKAGDTFTIRPSDIATAEELPVFLKNVIKNELAAESEINVSLTKVANLIPAALDETLYRQVFQGAEVTDEAQFKA